MAYDGSLIFDTKIDNKGFKKGVEGLKGAAKTSMKVVNGLMIAGAVAVAGIGIASIKAGSTFESGMSQVAATMGITVDEIKNGSKSFEMLEKAALDMGKATQFSATDASEALNYLALAGYDAEKAVETLPKVLNLAAAGGLELGHASELITQSMNALGLESNQLEGFVDQLAVTAQSSGTNVAQLGEAIIKVGGVAKDMAGGTVELNTQLGILADAGFQGAEGGTALRNVLLALSAPSDKQAKVMKKLGVETYDANGEFKHTDEIFQDLNKSLGKLSKEDKANALREIFGKVDVAAVNALLAASGDRFEELSTKIEKSEGAAADMAATMNDNLLGKIELLKSAMEYLGIMIYKSVDSPLSNVVETMTGYIDKISGVMTAHDDIKASAEELGMTAEELGFNLSEIPNGFEGMAIVIGEVLADMLVKMAEAAPKMLEMGVKLITTFLDGIQEQLPGITEAATDVIMGFIAGYLQIAPQILVLGIDLIRSFIQGLAFAMPELIPLAVEAVSMILNSIVENLPMMVASGIEIMIALIDGIVETLPKLINIALEMLPTLISGIMQSLPLMLQAGIDILFSLIDGIIEMLPDLITTAIDLIILIADKLIENIDLIIDAGIQIIMAVTKGIMDNLPKLIKEVPRIINSFADAIYKNLPTILKSAILIMLELIKGLIQSIPELVKNIPAIIMAIVNVFTLYNWYNLGKNVITKLGAGISNMIGNIRIIASNLATNVISAIKGLWSNAPSIGKGLVRHLIDGIASLLRSIVSSAGSLASDVLAKVTSGFTGAKNIGADMVRGLWAGILSVKEWILTKINGFTDSIMSGIKGFFGIKSPSTKMRDEVGIMLGKGLVVGIDKSKNDVDSSANRMAKSVLDIAKKMNRDNKVEVTKYNEEIKQLEKRAKEDIHSIEAKASNNKRKLTQDEVIRIQRIKEDSIKKVKALEEKASKESIKIAQQNSKLLLSMSEEYIKEKQRKGEMSLKDEVHFWNQLSLIVNSKSEEYKVALENRQKAISQINAEVIKINEDYTKQMLDIDKKLVEETEKLNDQYAKAYESRVSDLVGVGGLFNGFVENDMIAGDKLISNLESQVVALGQYEGIIGILGERIGNADLVSELEQLGPKSIGELKSLASLTDEQLAEYVNLYEVKFKMAARQAEKELAPMKENTERQIEELNKASQEKLSILQVEWTKSIQNLVTGTEKELDTLNLVGVNAIKGLEDGMLSMEGSLMETAQRIASNIASTIKSALDIHSPSRLMRDQVGKNITRGIGVGLKDGMNDLERDVKSEMSRLTKQMKATVDIETISSARVITGSSGYSRGNEVITNNNDNGVVQNVTIVSPQNTPSENARQMKKVGRELALGY